MNVITLILWISICLYTLCAGAKRVITHKVKFADYVWMWLLAMWMSFANLIRC